MHLRREIEKKKVEVGGTTMTAEERNIAMKEREKIEERKKTEKKKKGFDMFAEGDQVADDTDVSSHGIYCSCMHVAT